MFGIRKTKSATDIKPRRNWLSKWWPCLFIIGLLSYGIIDYFFFPKIDNINLITFLINGLGVLAIVIYVMYTKDLAESSNKTAEANIKIVESMQSRILEQWECRKCDNIHLIRGGEEVSRAIHISDKQISERDYEGYKKTDKLRVLIFKPMNMGPRPVLLKRIKFGISDSRAKVERNISYDPEPPIVIQKEVSIELQVCYDIEGMIAARIVEIEYKDGDIVQTLWTANPFNEKRHEIEPELEGKTPV